MPLDANCSAYPLVNKMLADVDEHTRLDIQHQMLKTQMDALYWPTDHVRRILAPRPEGCEPPAIMDIGTGSGECMLDNSGPSCTQPCIRRDLGFG